MYDDERRLRRSLHDPVWWQDARYRRGCQLKKAMNHGIDRGIFMIDLDDQPITDEMRTQAQDTNVDRKADLGHARRVFVWSAGRVEEITLR